MTTGNVLTIRERDKLTMNLSDEQTDFISKHLKQRKKAAFANVIAIEDGGTSWELVDYKDGGAQWKTHKELQCECGKTLRYQYTVKNLDTGVERKFGIVHFVEHTGIRPELAKAIVKGWRNIDSETDELLMKIEHGWTLEGIVPPSFLELIDVPDDIKQHLDAGIPLLERQVRSLQGKVNEYLKLQEKQGLVEFEKNKMKLQKEIKQRRSGMVSELLAMTKLDDVNLNHDLQLGVLLYLNDLDEERVSARTVCNYLIEWHGAPNDTFSSSTLRIFPDVCLFLTRLEENGTLEFVEGKGTEDRIFLRK